MENATTAGAGGVLDTIATERLIGDRLCAEHFDDLCQMHSDPTVMATLAGVRSHDWTRVFLQKNLEHWDRYGFGLWVFRDRATGQFVGRAGLRHYQWDGNADVELAYALMSEFWGQGLAPEIAQASLRVGFQPLGIPSIVCFTLPTNRASQRVMEKVGFQYERDFVHADLPHVFYRLTTAQWSGLEARSVIKRHN